MVHPQTERPDIITKWQYVITILMNKFCANDIIMIGMVHKKCDILITRVMKSQRHTIIIIRSRLKRRRKILL